jgi:hypothetical protein
MRDLTPATVSTSTNTQISLHVIDKTIQEQGKKLRELVQLFKNANIEPLSTYLLQSPKHKFEFPEHLSP